MSDVIAQGVIQVTVDGTGVEAGIAKANKSIATLGNAGVKAGNAGSKGLDKLGDGAEKSAEKFNRASASIIGQVKREIDALEAGSKSSAKYFASRAKSLGADPAAIQPYIEQLQTLERSQVAVGNSAKQTAFALRGLPAQFSDIAISLQGGQRPLSVFLQQGAQIKDTFGGVGPALRAMSGYIIGLINPFTLAAAAAGGLALAYYAGSEESSRLNKALISTGNIAGTSVGKLNDMASAVGAISGNYGLAREAAEALATSGKISGDNLQAALRGIVSGSNLAGGSVKTLVKEFEAIAKDPVKGLLELNEKYNFLSANVLNTVKALQQQGKAQEAVTVATNAFSNAVTSRDAEIKQSLGFIESAWKTIKSAISGATDEALAFGRVQSNASKLADIQSKLGAKSGLGSGNVALYSGEARKQLEAQRDELLKITKAADDAAAAIAKAQQTENKKIALSAYAEDSSRLSKAGQLSKQLADENAAFATAVAGFDKNSKEYQTALRAHETAVSNILATNKKENKAAPVNTYAKELAETYAALYKSGEALVAPQESQIERQQRLIDSFVGMDTAYKTFLQNQINDAKDTAFEQQIYAQATAADAAVEAINKSAEAIKLETENFGKSASAITDSTIARKEYIKSVLEGAGATTEQIDEEIGALKRLREAQFGNEAVKAAKKSADEIDKQFEKTSDNIARSLTDAIFRGFEDGKSFGKNFLDNLKNMFKTAILKPVVQFLVDSTGVSKVMASITSGLTGVASSSANAAASAGGSSSIMSSGTNIYTAITKGFSQANNAYFTGIAKLGQSFANAGFDKLGNLITVNSALIGKVLPYSGAVLALVKGDYKSALLQGVGVAIGSYFGGPIGGAIGGMIGSYVSGLFGSSVPRPKYYANTMVSSTGATLLNASRNGDGNSATLAAISNAALGIAGTVSKYSSMFEGTIAKSFKLGIDYQTKYDAFGVNFGRNATNGGSDFAFKAADITNSVANIFFASVKKGFISLPEYLSNIIKRSGNTGTAGIDSLASIKSLYDSLDNLPPVFNAVRQTIEHFATSTAASVKAVQERLQAFATYTDLFYSDSEKQDTLKKQLTAQFTDLGLSLPATREMFRSLVDGIDATTVAGYGQVNALVDLAPYADAYYKALQAEIDAKKQATDATNALIDSLMNTSKFKTLADEQTYRGVGQKYGAQFAADNLSNLNAGRIQVTNGNAGINGTTDIVGAIKALREEPTPADVEMVKALQEVAKLLKRWEGGGLPAEREVVA